MRPVEDIQWVNDGLVYWEGYDPSVKVDLSSHAISTPEGWVLVDPIPLLDELVEELRARINVAAILITSANHERAAAFYKSKCAVPVIAHAEAEGGLEMKIDQTVTDGDLIFGLSIIHLPGFASGEIALHSPGHEGLLAVGDSIINLPPDGLAVLPDKYCEDPKLARRSAQKLLQFSFEVMTFAHGQPIIAGARKKLETLLS